MNGTQYKEPRDAETESRRLHMLHAEFVPRAHCEMMGPLPFGFRWQLVLIKACLFVKHICAICTVSDAKHLAKEECH